MDKQLLDKLKKIKLLVLDFDGVLTDGYVYVDIDGREMVRCNHHDGTGIKLLREEGIKLFVLSGQVSAYVAARCRKMNIPFQHAVLEKHLILKEMVTLEGLSFSEVAYVGDDINDLGCLKIAGVAFAVANCHSELKLIVHYVTVKEGGKGAVREICDLILKAKRIGGEK